MSVLASDCSVFGCNVGFVFCVWTLFCDVYVVLGAISSFAIILLREREREREREIATHMVVLL